MSAIVTSTFFRTSSTRRDGLGTSGQSWCARHAFERGLVRGPSRRILAAWLVAVCLPSVTRSQTIPRDGVISWGDRILDDRLRDEHFVQASGGGSHTVALRRDGTVAAWGYNDRGQCNVPSLPPGIRYARLEAGYYYTLGLRSDGTITGWGDNRRGQCDAPALPSGVSYIQVSSGFSHALALRSDGSAIGWGLNQQGQATVPTLPPGLRYLQVGAGDDFSVALRSDGSVIAWGANDYGQRSVPPLPSRVVYVQISVGRQAREFAHRAPIL